MEQRGVRPVCGEFYNVLDPAARNLRKTLSVRGSCRSLSSKNSVTTERAGDDAVDSSRAGAGATYLIASGVVLLLGPVLRGRVLCDIDLSSVKGATPRAQRRPNH